MLPVPLTHLPSWSQPLRLLISQTDSSLPAASSRRPGTGAAPSAARPPARPSVQGICTRGKRWPRGWGRRLGHPIRGKFHRRRFHVVTCHPGRSTRVRGPPSASVTAARPPPRSRELLISSVSETRAASSPGFIFY